MRSLTHRRWTLLLSLALIGWLWLAVVHVHHDDSHGRVGAHPTCDLCAGVDRSAPPPVNAAAVLTLPAHRPAVAAPTIIHLPVELVHAYSSQAPPSA
ncbi:MAG: hypothetical protein ACKO0U_02955 [Gammaproteobacteria bacterium]